MNQTILIVEDNEDVSKYLREILTENRYLVHEANMGSHALQIVEKTQPDLILLDLGLPDIDGESLAQQIKREFPDMPIIVLTARDTKSDLVRNLKRGADDYVTKPFDTDELLARIQARLRDTNKKNPIMAAADLILNTETIEVTRNGKPIELTATEFQLLTYLLANKNKVLSRDMILSHVWSYTPDIESRVVDVYIGYLRKKIDKGFAPKLIHSVRGFGYVLRDE